MSSYVSWINVVLVMTSLVTTGAALSGQNICTKIETYEVPITKTAQKPYVVREVVWCMQVPPRCLKTRTEYRTQIVTENVSKTRVVSECCEGYSELDERCVPLCWGEFNGCGENGKCVAPNICQCIPGYHGTTCTEGYALTTTIKPSTKEQNLKPSLQSDTEDQFNEHNNEINVDISQLTIDLPQQLSTKPVELETTTSAPIIIITTTMLPEYSSISKNKYKSIKNHTEKIKTKKLTSSSEILKISDGVLETSDNSTIISPLELSSTDSIDSNSTLIDSKSNHTKNTLVKNLPSITKNSTNPFIKNPSLKITPEQVTENSSLPITEEKMDHDNSTMEDINGSSDITSTMNNSDVTTIEKADHIAVNQSRNMTTIETQRDNTSIVIGRSRANDDSSLLLMINNETSVHNQHVTFGVDLLSAIMLILGASLALLLVIFLLVMVCSRRTKIKPAPQKQTSTSQQGGTSVRHMQLPPTPQDTCPPTAMFTPNNNVVILQHVTMATTNNTFKPAAQQPTISPALREALEAHYDHPPTWRRGTPLTLHTAQSSEVSDETTSLAQLWDAVVNSVQQQEDEEVEHLYDEIPCWKSQPVEHNEHDMVTKC